MPHLLPLTVTCPQCGSRDVVYSCEPECCFNHVCGACYTSFQLVTAELDERLAIPDVALPERDSCAPTVACAHCESLAVYLLDTGDSSSPRLICTACHTRLELGFTEVSSR